MTWRAHPNWEMTGLFLLALVLLIFLMRLTAWFISNPIEADQPFWLLPSPTSFRRSRPATNPGQVVLKTVLLFGAALLSYWVYDRLVRAMQIRGLLLSYCGAPILLLLGETLAGVTTLLAWPSGRLFPPLHNWPPCASSVADFWGKRWNLWFSDWFRFAIFRPLHHRPVLALVLVFAVSGLMHEWVINVPLYFVTGRAVFGSMMIYFLLQAAGLLLERRIFRKQSNLGRIFTWIVVLAPVPLIINEGLLRALHLWPI
jgi:alginate O-acetyltransferase complex protein AlgI